MLWRIVFILKIIFFLFCKFAVEDDDTKARSSNNGMDGIISKPVKPVELKKHLWNIFNSFYSVISIAVTISLFEQQRSRQWKKSSKKGFSFKTRPIDLSWFSVYGLNFLSLLNSCLVACSLWLLICKRAFRCVLFLLFLNFPPPLFWSESNNFLIWGSIPKENKGWD